MALQTYVNSVRLDALTNLILENLVIDFDFNKSQVMRRAIRALKQLSDIQKLHGEIKILTKNGNELLIFLI